MAIHPPPHPTPTPLAWTCPTSLHYNGGVGVGQEFFLAPRGEVRMSLDFFAPPCSISFKDLVSITKYLNT